MRSKNSHPAYIPPETPVNHGITLNNIATAFIVF